MNKEYRKKYFFEKLSFHIKQLIPKELVKKLVDDYENTSQDKDIKEKNIIDICEKEVFQNDIINMVNYYFGCEYYLLHKEFNTVDKSTESSSISYWHLDYGTKKTLRLFIYLNSVSEHGGNTLLIDKERSKKLEATDAITFERTNDTKDIKPYLQKLRLDTNCLSYNLDAGDGLLLNPVELVHRCLPPTIANAKRYTVCFMFIPSNSVR